MMAYIVKNYVILPNEELKVRFNHLFLYTTQEREIIKLKKLWVKSVKMIMAILQNSNVSRFNQKNQTKTSMNQAIP